ncbi:MAG: hypothetical protein ACFE8A_06610 [Candidatus Hodarchaeota archaeon]
MEKTLKFHELYKFDIKKIQKCEFKLISELVHNLFKYENCRDCFINISNLIILFLTVFKKDTLFDIYSGYEDEFELIDEDIEYRNILREELNGFL